MWISVSFRCDRRHRLAGRFVHLFGSNSGCSFGTGVPCLQYMLRVMVEGENLMYRCFWL